MMERDSMLSHGSSAFLQERLVVCSDDYRVIICDSCGQISKSQNECKICGHTEVSQLKLPYAAKLLFQQLQSMGIKMNINPTN